MGIEKIKVEKVALFLLTTFILILFLDYSFDIREIISEKYKIDIKDISKLRYLILISIVPILYFIGKTEFDKKPDILSNSINPFLTFILGFYLLKISFFKSIDGVFILMFIQLISSLTFIILVSSLFSLLLKWFNNKNEEIFNKGNTVVNNKEFVVKTLEMCRNLIDSVLNKIK